VYFEGFLIVLIGLDRKFIFVANLKVASTSIAEILRPLSEIALVESRFEKHLPYWLIEERFNWIFSLIKREDFFVFGVMRDPVDFVVSLFNSHTDEKFREYPTLYTGDLDFDGFINEWTKVNSDQIAPQFTRFLTKEGKIGANYIISYSNLGEGLDYVASVIDAPALRTLPHANVSNRRICRNDLSGQHLEWIARALEQDGQFIEKFCDRMLPNNLVPFEGMALSAPCSSSAPGTALKDDEVGRLLPPQPKRRKLQWRLLSLMAAKINPTHPTSQRV